MIYARYVHVKATTLNRAGHPVSRIVEYGPIDKQSCVAVQDEYEKDVLRLDKLSIVPVPTGYKWAEVDCLAQQPIRKWGIFRYDNEADGTPGGITFLILGDTGQSLRVRLVGISTTATPATNIRTAEPGSYSGKPFGLFEETANYGVLFLSGTIPNGTYRAEIIDGNGTVLQATDLPAMTSSAPRMALPITLQSEVAVPRFLANVTYQLPPTTPPGNGADPFVDHNVTSRYNAMLGAFLNGRDGVTGGIQSFDEEMIRWSKGHHFNMFSAKLTWKYGESATGVFDFRQVDTVLALAADLQMPVVLFYDFAVTLDDGPENYIPVADRMVDHTGQVMASGNSSCGSYDSAAHTARKRRFLVAHLAHLNASPHAAWVAVVSVCNGMQVEDEYRGNNNNNNNVVYTDYSTHSRNAFVARMRANNTLAALNARWGTSFSSDAAITLPVPQDGNWGATRMLRDFYNHRQLSIAEHTQFWHDLVKGTSTNIKTLYRCGNIWDNFSLTVRGTIGLPAIIPCDIIMQDSEPAYPLAVTQAIAQRDGRSSYNGADTVFFIDYAYSQDQQVKWFTDNYAARVGLVTWESFYVFGGEGDAAKMAQGKAWISAVMDRVHAQYPIGTTFSRPTPTRTINVLMSQLLSYTWQNARNGQPSYTDQIAQAINQTGQQPAVIITNDL